MYESISRSRDDSHEAGFPGVDKKLKLETTDLVGALNEHIQLRMQGNQLYGEFILPKQSTIRVLICMSSFLFRSSPPTSECMVIFFPRRVHSV
jgi:hypothetical protein